MRRSAISAFGSRARTNGRRRGAEPPAMPVLPDGLGVNIHFTDAKPGEMEMLAEGGFRWVRMDFAWGGTEREKGKYDFTAYDRLLKSLDEHKIRALLILDYSNRHYDGGLSPHSDEGRKAFARWAAAAAKHFQRPRHPLGDVQRAEHRLLEAQARREPVRQAGPGSRQGHPRGRARRDVHRPGHLAGRLGVPGSLLQGRAAGVLVRRLGASLSPEGPGDGGRRLRQAAAADRPIRAEGQEDPDPLGRMGLFGRLEELRRGAARASICRGSG